MTFNFNISTLDESLAIEVKLGSSLIFVGANGGGKTRLAVKIEEIFGALVHRISAHRSLAMDPAIEKISERKALNGLRYGHPTHELEHRVNGRWKYQAAVGLLNDFNFVIQALFADQNNITKAEYDKKLAGDQSEVKQTKMRRLQAIWSDLLPHRILQVTGDDILVSVPGQEKSYSASEMSDGERAVFYVIGQALLAEQNSLLVIDEPELHMHRSIMSKLWDQIEAARPDCAFVYITHDLEFAADRAAQKFVVHRFVHPDQWEIEPVPEDTGFDESLTTLILGSRRPILFVEGAEDGLDTALYRCCFPGYTVIARGSCEDVVRAVTSLRRNGALTRVTCAGMVDADGLHDDEIEALAVSGVSVLPVSEIENLFLLPQVSRAIAVRESLTGDDLEKRLADLQDKIFQTLANADAIETVVLRYCRRRIDRLLKKMDLGPANSVAALNTSYLHLMRELNINSIADAMRERISNAVATKDLPKLLALYDNKGLLSLAATHLRNQKLADFKSWITRALRAGTEPDLIAAIKAALPSIL